MMDECSTPDCDRVVDVDGYRPELHGPIYCDACQPKCSTCRRPEFLGVCPKCQPDQWAGAQAFAAGDAEALPPKLIAAQAAAFNADIRACRELGTAAAEAINRSVTRKDASISVLSLEERKLKPGDGFAMRVESIEVDAKTTSISMMDYVGDGSRPKYRPWWEWVRVNLLSQPPRFIPINFKEMLRSPPRGFHTLDAECQLRACLDKDRA